MDTAPFCSEQLWTLPPLILHPFSDASGPNKLVESSRASLMLQGLLPSGDLSPEQLERRLLDGRYCEVRMLYYVGRDVVRWVDQCMEVVERDERLRDSGIGRHSFYGLLIHATPAPVREKLKRWGVADYQAIFTRSVGLNLLFADAPDPDILATEFIRNYYRYADQMFVANQKAEPYTTVTAETFDFELFASGEYSRMLEREWGTVE
ncbi:MAG TPA: hypothetical protein DEH78_32080 [Solibacterales bacterium]|nr:hypothetical protein [Bryobacterales bacterium]